jgi:hypothetical protein
MIAEHYLNQADGPTHLPPITLFEADKVAQILY